MPKAQQWLDQEYPQENRKNITNLDIRSESLEGELLIENWPNLERLDCGFNQLTSIKISNLPKLNFFSARNCQLSDISINNCPEISNFNVKKNSLSDSTFISNINPEKLTFLDVGSNNFPPQDLSVFSNLINLKELYFGNGFIGSLETLKGLTRLKSLGLFTPNIDSGLEYLSVGLEKIYCHSKKESDKSLKIWEELKDYPIKDKHEFVCYDYQAWREDNAERIELLNIDKVTLLRQFKSLKEEYMELQKRFGQLQEQMMNLDKKLLQSSPSIIISPNFSNTANFSNQIIYQVRYNDQRLQKELTEIKKNYQTLEPTNELPSDSQKLKKTILFLGAKQIFATTRQATINKLIETYENANKLGKNYDKITLIASYLGDAGEIAASIVPGGSTVVKVINKGIPIITNLLKSHSLTAHSQEFGNYLIADEKSLFLLQKTYQSVVDSQNNSGGKISPLLTNLLKLNQGQFDQHGIFEISKLQKEEELTSEKMQKTIDLLTNHFQEFIKELQQETKQYAEKMEEIFAGAEGELLQIELTELLEKLVGKESRNQELNLINQSEDLQSRIESKETYLQKLVADAKNKIKSEHRLFSERRNKERAEMINNLLNMQAEIIHLGNTIDRQRKLISLQSKLLEIANEHKHIGFKIELDNLCQVQRELTQLQIELEQRAHIQIPPK